MSDIAVRAENLTKVYTLYPSPWDRMRDLLGWRRRGADFPTHTAIDGLDLEIHAGEKVGFIGRNGAGKSTLLKLITGVIEPTGGRLEINGDTHALLQMGAGFHEDFTGRQNAYGYLANLGLTGERADTAVDEIIEFSELEEYIDQPLKTYSTGMKMRLIFAASTTVAPKLFVIDEVLGVGDAYFQQKSFARIQDLVTTHRTTLLLVSHDIYSTARICDRIVWIDRGRIKFDGAPRTALDLYDASIKEQEEARLRKKKLGHGIALPGPTKEGLIVELQPQEDRPLNGALYFSRLTLLLGDQVMGQLEISPDQANAGSAQLYREASSWGEIQQLHGRTTIPLLAGGSIFDKGSCVFMIASKPAPSEIGVCMDVYSEHDAALEVSFFCQNDWLPGDTVAIEGRKWNTVRINGIGNWSPLSHRRYKKPSKYGTGALRITGACLVDGQGEDTLIILHGEPFHLIVDLEAVGPFVEPSVEAILALHRDGVDCVCRTVARDLPLALDNMNKGRIDVRIPSLNLVDGIYTCTLLVARRNYMDSGSKKFFSINPDIYVCSIKFLEFRVKGSPSEGAGATFLVDAAWSTAQRC